jgi:diguanylate cyclase (GGDEF)-like protein/PAS domain S-box-containing protein
MKKLKSKSMKGRNLPNVCCRGALYSLYDGICFVDKEKKILFWNNGIAKHTGYDSSEVMGTDSWENILKPIDTGGAPLSGDCCPVTQTLRDGKVREMEVYLTHKKKHTVPVYLRIAPVNDHGVGAVVAMEILSDTSPKFTLSKRLNELERAALVDPLTGLPNRRYMEMSLQSSFEELQRYRWPFGVLFIDIDHFKNINDTYGHDAGDRLMRTVGNTMLHSLRPFDQMGQWGGEKFLAILVNIDKGNLYSVAHRTRLIIERSTIVLGEKNIRVTVSIGATRAYTWDTVNTVIQRADHLLYQSKQSGRNCVSMQWNSELKKLPFLLCLTNTVISMKTLIIKPSSPPFAKGRKYTPLWQRGVKEIFQ